VKILFLTGKTGYTRARRTCTRSNPWEWDIYPTRPVPVGTGRVGSGIPAGTGKPAHLYYLPFILVDYTTKNIWSSVLYNSNGFRWNAW